MRVPGSAIAAILVLVLTGCSTAQEQPPGTTASNSAGQDVLSASRLDESAVGEDYVPTSPSVTAYTPSEQEVRAFESIPESYFTQHVTPDASLAAGTVVNLQRIDPTSSQVFYLWEEGNAPGGERSLGADGDGFRAALTTVPVPEGTQIRGAVLLEAGGAFMFRGALGDAYPTAEELSKRGYQCFVVDYRLNRDLGAIDLARAVRFVESHWQDYGLPKRGSVAVMGFSAGGIAAGQMLLDWDGTTSPQAYDADYVPDELDSVSADVAADGMIYSFYGRLSVASKDVNQLRAGDLPPTYFVYGSRDPFVHEFEANIQTLERAGVEVQGVALRGWPHGFGAVGGWIDGYDAFLQQAFDV